MRGARQKSASARRDRPRPKPGLWRNANMVFCNGQPLPADLAAAIPLPVKMENDANCFALSEAFDGAGAGYPVVCFYTIGTALGGGLVIDGKLRSGPNAEAAEFGHLPLPWPNETEWPLLPCFCGKAGCVEQYVSGTGLARDYNAVTGQSLKGAEIVAQGAGWRKCGQGGAGAVGRSFRAAHREPRQYARSRYFRGRRRIVVVARTGRGTRRAREPLQFLRKRESEGGPGFPWGKERGPGCRPPLEPRVGPVGRPSLPGCPRTNKERSTAPSRGGLVWG